MTDPIELKKPLPGDSCLICGGFPTLIGVFVPEDAQAWGAPDGKTRFVRYCLCSRCAGCEGMQEKVEKIIRADLAGGGSRC